MQKLRRWGAKDVTQIWRIYGVTNSRSSEKLFLHETHQKYKSRGTIHSNAATSQLYMNG